jgi:hypothetical protein
MDAANGYQGGDSDSLSFPEPLRFAPQHAHKPGIGSECATGNAGLGC